ncbi:MAG: phosphoribosyl-AMP cyclohydrolase [Coriobacteriia bacterium]|nr:phosphoribosyl-AMP cyclohydrolase [Coriobacteriia bacterium]MCL2537385.1 phosphoribosyl-AMP cyclohydrolase [Coriobacteriia bacterium]
MLDIERDDLQPQQLSFNAQGLMPAIIQDVETKDVLMLAWMNREALERSLQTGYTWFWSRSRGRLWQKGEESGNTQSIESVRYDCDADTLLILVRQGGDKLACHTGKPSCFYRTLN